MCSHSPRLQRHLTDVAGFEWARAKMPGMLTTVNTALAGALLALAAAVDTAGSDDNTRFGIVAGSFGVANAILGWAALTGRWPRTSIVHVHCTFFASTAGALVAAACIAAGNVRARERVHLRRPKRRRCGHCRGAGTSGAGEFHQRNRTAFAVATVAVGGVHRARSFGV